MKRLIIFIMCIANVVLLSAKPVKLYVEKLFDDAVAYTED